MVHFTSKLLLFSLVLAFALTMTITDETSKPLYYSFIQLL